MGDNNGITFKLPIKVKLNGGMMPTKATRFDAAYDIRVPEDVMLNEGRQTIDMKFALEIPNGYAAIIQPRSGFSAKGIECVGADGSKTRIDGDVKIGLIDSSYRNNIGVTIQVKERYARAKVLYPHKIAKGTRIAQMRIVEVPDTELVEVDELDMTNDRGGGFGHTGVK